jgi:hypothetical protein
LCPSSPGVIWKKKKKKKKEKKKSHFKLHTKKLHAENLM